MAISQSLLVPEERRKRLVDAIVRAILQECITGKECSCFTQEQHKANLVKAEELGIVPQKKAVTL